MRASIALCVVLPLAPTAALAQDTGGWNPTAALMAVSADLHGNRNGTLEEGEWRSFVDPLGSDASGRIDRARLKGRIFTALLDEDGDGDWDAEDIAATFATMDADGDGNLSLEEVLGALRQANGDPLAGTGAAGPPTAGPSFDVSIDRALARELLVMRADADRSRSIRASEWEAFTAQLALVDASLEEQLLVWMREAEAEPPPEDRNAFTPGVYLLTLDSEFDLDKNGRLDRADLARAYSDLDANADGTVAADEIAQPPGAFAQLEGDWHRPTPEDWTKPCLIPWQRNLQDALALVEATGKPLLVCVNMNDETACDSLASRRYRDPAFARLASGFVPLIVSPDRRNPRDYNDRGARIEDPRFGRVTTSEAIDIEPTVYDLYFDGRRVAPRHIGVSPEGEVLFDIFLIQDARIIDEALRTHGVFTPPTRPASELETEQLLASPDAADRSELERRFLEERTEERLRLVRRALRPTRGTIHPEIVRMALLDDEPEVRAAAASAIAAAPTAVPSALLSKAFEVGYGDLGLRATLADIAHGLVDPSADPTQAYEAAQRARTFEGLTTQTALFDVERWTLAVSGALPEVQPAYDQDAYDALVTRLDELTAAIDANPRDRELKVMRAMTAMRCSDARMALSIDPTFTLQDAERFAAGATSVDDPEGRALAVMALARWFQGDPEGAGRHAAAALPHLLPHAQTDLARRALHVLANSRARSIYGAMNEQRSWPARWLSEAHAAFQVLVAHPGSEEADARAHLDLLRTLGANAEEGEAVIAALERFPLSGDMHNYLRFQTLRDGGAERLDSAYRRLRVPAAAAPTVSWFQGLAELVAAEHLVNCKQPEEAIQAYRQSVRTFADVVAEVPGFADSSNHYVALALAGSARLHAQLGELETAAELAAEGISVRPASAASPDGLGHSPSDNASYVLEALAGAGDDERAEALRANLRAQGVEAGG